MVLQWFDTYNITKIKTSVQTSEENALILNLVEELKIDTPYTN